MSRPVLSPYRLLAFLLYTRADYLERELPLIVAGTDGVCKQLRISPRSCQSNLEWLENAGLIRDYKWKKHYFNVYLLPPVEMDYL